MRKINYKKYGWQRDLPDYRDYNYSIYCAKEIQKIFPSKVDLRLKCPPIYDQGQLGSCTANAIAGNIGFIQNFFMASRLFIYYNERTLEGTTKTDSGAAIRDGIKTVNQQGVCPETMWAYIISKFATKPPISCYAQALKDVITQYLKISTLSDMKNCLVAGYPFVFGFSVYTNFESAIVARTGIINLPTKGEKLLGGHAVMCVGYDDSTQRFIVRNSWGTSWGQKGYFTIPYNYLTNSNLASDFWTIRK